MWEMQWTTSNSQLCILHHICSGKLPALSKSKTHLWGVSDEKNLSKTLWKGWLHSQSKKLSDCTGSGHIHYIQNNVLYCNFLTTCTNERVNKKYSAKLLCHGINFMFNPVAFLINVKIKELDKNLKPFLDDIEKDPMILEELAKIARRKKVTTQGCIISRSGKD